MKGMLNSTPGNSQPLLNIHVNKQTQRQIFQSSSTLKGSLPAVSAWGHQHHHNHHHLLLGAEQGEPTSVLDIRSPSPTSTLSSSVGGGGGGGTAAGGAGGGGGASSVESGAVAAVSGLLCESLSDNSNANGALQQQQQHQQQQTNSAGSSASPKAAAAAAAADVLVVKREDANKPPEEWNASGVPGVGAAATGAGMEDLESILLETGAGAPDQSLMRYLLGEAPVSEEPVHFPDTQNVFSFANTGAPHVPTDPVTQVSTSNVYTALPPLSEILPNPTQSAITSPFLTQPQVEQPQNPQFFYPAYQSTSFPTTTAARPESFTDTMSTPHMYTTPNRPVNPAMIAQPAPAAPAMPPAVGTHPVLQGRAIGPPTAAFACPAQTAVEQLVRAAEWVEEGSIGQAQAILARLNHTLTPVGKPIQRAAYYFKESLISLIRNDITRPRNVTAADIVQKIGAYKSFAEASPLAQFGNLTATQALLEAAEGEQALHVVDLDLGLGGHWAPLLQELAFRTPPPAVRLTALGQASAETILAGENLRQFAKSLEVPFEFSATPEALAPARHPGEMVVVVITQSAVRRLGTTESFVRVLRELSPKAAVFLDSEPPVAGTFTAAFFEALRFYAFMFDSLDSVNMAPEAVQKAEKFLFAPKIDAAVLSAARSEQRPPLRAVMPMLGMCLAAPSNFTETQADCLTRRSQARGFQIVKSQATLLLAWQGQPLVSATAWRVASAANSMIRH